MVHALYDPETARNIACAATLLCLWLSAHYAQKIRQERPRAFTALSLLALNWAILLLYCLPGTPDVEAALCRPCNSIGPPPPDCLLKNGAARKASEWLAPLYAQD